MANWQDTKKEIRKYTEVILGGTILVIDPSSGGGESNPGYSWYSNGQLIKSGEIRINPTWKLPDRLYSIAYSLREFEQPDILVVEHIRRIQGTFGGPSVDALLKGVGAIFGAVTAGIILEIPPISWVSWAKKNCPDYIKGDEQDAIFIGRFLIEQAREMRKEFSEDERPRKAPSNRKTRLCKLPKKKVSSPTSRSTSRQGKSKKKLSRK